MVCALALVLAAAVNATANATVNAPVIDVFGVRRERDYESGPGQSTTIAPSRPGRANLSERLRGEAAFEVLQDGGVRASGFSLPSIRNIPGRYADVYIENIPIFDPYLGRPFTDEIDLRAFAAVQLVKGLPPPQITSFGSSGVLRYRLRDAAESAVGAAVGRPFGASGFGLLEHGSPQSEFVGRIYARQHATSGGYRYFDDNNTPYNTADDGFATRINNDRRAALVMPSGTWRRGQWNLSVLGLASDSSGGMPGLGDLRYARKARLSGLSLQRRFDPEGVAQFSLRFATDHQANKLNGEWRAFATTNSGFTVAYAHTGEFWFARWDAGLSALDGGEREFVDSRAGLSGGVVLGEHLLRARLSARQQEEELDRGAAFEYGYQFLAGEVYAQVSRAERGPAYIDRFGDGGLIQAAEQLNPEIIRHNEVGYKLRRSAYRLGLSLFNETIEQQILLLPVTQPFFRAQNIAASRSKGLDLTAQANVVSGVLLEVSGLFSQTTGKDEKPLPLSPSRRIVTNVEWQIADTLVLNGTSRYQDEFFLDRANSQKAPGLLLHDLAFGTVRARGIGGTLTITNVTDETANSIEAPESGARGKTAIANFRGYPLPGRSWRLDFEYLF